MINAREWIIKTGIENAIVAVAVATAARRVISESGRGIKSGSDIRMITSAERNRHRELE